MTTSTSHEVDERDRVLELVDLMDGFAAARRAIAQRTESLQDFTKQPCSVSM